MNPEHADNPSQGADRGGSLQAQSIRFLLAPVVSLLDDATVSEIMINGAHDIRVERKGKITRTELKFSSEAQLLAAVRNIAQYVGKRITPDTARFDARLPDGSRVHVVLPPASRQGVCVAIRKFQQSRMSFDSLVSMGAISPEAREFIELCVLIEKNMIVAGGTGTGKTSLLNVLSSLIHADHRILVLEDTSELALRQDHVLYFETKPPDRHGQGAVSIRDLFHSSLRMRPDRIVVGECRGGEALDLIQAMTSGHGGSMTTLHANSPADSLNRLETMALMSGIEMPLVALRSQVASAIDVVLQLGRFHDGSRKVLEIAEVRGLDDEGRYDVHPIYSFAFHGKGGDSHAAGQLRRTGVRPSFWAEVQQKGYTERVQLTKTLFEPEAEGIPAGGSAGAVRE
jgi:pilus assembly protein CpaF